MRSLLFPKNRIFHIHLLETAHKHNSTFTMTTHSLAYQAHIKAIVSVNEVFGGRTGNFGISLLALREGANVQTCVLFLLAGLGLRARFPRRLHRRLGHCAFAFSACLEDGINGVYALYRAESLTQGTLLTPPPNYHLLDNGICPQGWKNMAESRWPVWSMVS